MRSAGLRTPPIARTASSGLRSLVSFSFFGVPVRISTVIPLASHQMRRLCARRCRLCKIAHLMHMRNDTTSGASHRGIDETTEYY